MQKCSKNLHFHSLNFLEIMLQITLLFLVCFSPTKLLAIHNNKTDYLSLLSFKHQLMKQQSNAYSAIFMSSWNDTNKDFCSWEGVSCGHKHPDRVTTLKLSSMGLIGSLPPSISNLTFLQMIDLSNNSLFGEIPPNLSNLQRLKYLDLSFNSFYGDIPAILMTNSSLLQVLALGNNQLTSKIPHINPISISPLYFLDLNTNQIIGTIPSSLGNLSSLESLYFDSNHLEGGIPKEIGGLGKLKYFNVGVNNISGMIPSSFYNLSSLLGVSMTSNHLSGDISASISQAFPNIEIFFIADNHFIGSLDQILQNVTSLVRLETSINNFTGVVPHFGKMHNLTYLSLQQNNLEATDEQDCRFFDSLSNCTKLKVLALGVNNLGGMLPKSIGNLSTELQILLLGANYISGSIPFEIGRYTNLIEIGIDRNFLEGSIPNNIGKLERLQLFSFAHNSLTGSIPHSLGNLTKLYKIDLEFNQLTGHIPSNLQNLHTLTYLDLSHNNLTGLIPREIFLIPSFSNYLDLSYNFFIGALPFEVGNLVSLTSLDFSNNKLNGKMPKSLGSCQLLFQLNMECNFFHGSIPTSLENIKNLEILDLSNNNLSGHIPQSLQNLTLLKHLNLSFNNLEGEVPYEGVFKNSSAISLIGNGKLCGGIPKLHLPRCVIRSSSTRSTYHLFKVLIPILSMLLVILLCYIFLYRRKKQSGQRRNSSDSSFRTPFSRISYAKLAKATNYFSTLYLVGQGRHGSIYRGILSDYQVDVAIKVFDLEVHGAFKSFTSECDALRNIRHHNLVRVLTSCSSIDFTGRDFKALVFEYIPKGNLGMWLHQENDISEEIFLNLKQRLNIAIDVAVALDYLHHSCQPMIIHCDMKPSNILLNHDMIAHIGDFGLARILFESNNTPIQDSNSDSKSAIKGTIGYVAPEYGVGARPSSVADVYSFGIILLEILTGKRPIDDMFKDGLNLHNHVSMYFPHEITNIADHKMFAEENRDAITNSIYQSINNCLVSMAEVGLSCSASSPDDRPNMKDVVTKLHKVRVTYLQSVSDSI